MATYSIVGNGIFGGSGNILDRIGGIGSDWGDGMANAMKFGTALQNYQNLIHTSPSATRAKIAENAAAQGTAEGDHYRNYMMNGVLSRLAGGLEPLDWQKNLMNQGYIRGLNHQNTGGVTGQVEGTPTTTATNVTPATTVATPPPVRLSNPVAQAPVGWNLQHSQYQLPSANFSGYMFGNHSGVR